MDNGRPAPGKMRRGTSFLLFALAIFSASLTQAAPEYAGQCIDCHDMPPLDSTTGGRIPTTGAFKGNHQTHADSRAVSCARCHGPNVVNYATGHRTKAIQVQGNINNSPLTATYSRAFVNQTSVPPVPLGSCSNVNCHFESPTPAWGSSTYRATADCGACHSAAPTSFAHSAHFATFGSGASVCAKCHPDYAASATPFAHATSVGKRVIAVRFATGSYAGGNTSFLPSQSATRTVGSCSSIYCHSRGQGAAGGALAGSDYVSASWSAPASGACGTCHATTTLATGSHTKHLALNSNCGTCHANASATSYRLPSHADGNVDVTGSYSAGGAPGNGYGTCAAATCHVSPYGTGSVTSPTWGSVGGCASCHNGTGAFGANGAPATGSHAKHMALTGAACGQCHSGAASGSSGGATHTNGSVDVTNGYTASPVAKHAIGSYTGTCTSTSCHNNGTGIYTGIAGASSTPVWGSAGGCGACHGNGSYSDYRKAAPLYPSGSPKRNAHDLHTQTGALTGHDVECKYCHAATVNGTNDAATSPPHAAGSYTLAAGGASYTFEDGDNISAAHTAKVATTLSYTYQDASRGNEATCSNVSCHPTGLAGTKSASKTAWNNKPNCTDCHKVNLQNATGYHHAMRNYSSGGAGYPTSVPGISAGANDNSRRCTMCHVDHSIFSPDLNTANAGGAAANLRSDIAVAVTKTSGYANSDFSTAGSGGICISCHTSELFKDTGNVRVKNEGNSTRTVAVTLKGYSSSAHEYAVASAMRRDGKGFGSNCSKCHNGRGGEVAAFSSLTTAVHDSPVRRLYATLGQQGSDGADAAFCFRCHSKTTDAVGGTKKAVAGKDYYGAATMSAAAEDIFTVFNGVGTASYSTTPSATLYLRNSNTINAVAPADPTGYQYSSGSYTTNIFTGNQYDMAPASGATTVTDTISTGTLAGNYNRGMQFVSPQIDNTVTIPSGASFTLTLRESRATGTSTDYTRFTVYKWNGSTATPLNTSAAPGNFAQNATAIGTTVTNRATTFTTNQAVTLNPGDALVCEVEFLHSAGTTALNVSYAFGNFGTDAAALALPAGTYNWRTASGAKPGHGVNNAAYTGVHKTSPADETFAYISANKHVSCNDCHNPHQGKAGNHSAGNAALAPVLRGATGVTTPAWPATWTAPAQSAYGTAPVAATAEWQVCFKCHSGANSNVATWGGSGAAAFTDLALEFNPNNRSGHPVITALNNYASSPTPKALKASQMKAPWTNVGNQVMTCSDCHGTDSTASKGPHGSSVKWMLVGTSTNWPFTSSAANGTASSGTLAVGGATSNITFCSNCHNTDFSSTGHGANGSSVVRSDHYKTCVGCHIRVPHGGKIPRLITGTNAPARYKPDGNGGGTIYLTGITKFNGSASKSNCYSTTSGCSGDHGTAGSTMQW